MVIQSPKRCALTASITLFLLLMTVSVLGQNIRTKINTDSITVGEPFQYTLVLQLDREYRKIEYPDTSFFPPSVEVINRQSYKVSEFTDSLIYDLQYFGNTDLKLSSFPIMLYTSEDTSFIYSDPAVLFFKSVVAEGDTTFKDLKPVYRFPLTWWPWVLAALLLIGALAWWWFKKSNRDENADTPEEVEIPPFYNPLRELEDRLVRLKQDNNIAENRNFKVFYSEMGDAIRQYFEDLYKIPALESTSNELIRYLDAYGVDDTLNDLTRKILRKADLVKFAKYTPTLDDAWATYELSKDFLERAKITDQNRIKQLKARYEAQFRDEHGSDMESVQEAK